MIGSLLGTGWTALKRTGEVGKAASRAVPSDVSHCLECFESSILVDAGKQQAPPATVRESGCDQLPLALRVARRGFLNIDLADTEKKAVLDTLAAIESGATTVSHTQEFREHIQGRLNSPGAADRLAEQHPNFLPSLLANVRQFPPLGMKGKIAFNFDHVPAKNMQFTSRDGRVYAEVTSSVAQLLGDTEQTRHLAEDYASDDVSLKLTIPLGGGSPSSYSKLPLSAKRHMLQQALKAAPKLTTLHHGFQSNKEIWDSTAAQWADKDSVTVAFDGFGGDGLARSDGSAPYTPKQYAFQMLESLDRMGLLGGKDLKVVGHSMGGAATGEMALALDKAGFQGKADFLLMAPACFPDHLPIFQTHRTAVDVANALLIGGIYIPLGAWELTAPLVQWTDEKFPIVSKLMVDYGLGLKDSPEHIRDHNAGYYRSSSPVKNKVRRQRSLEAMMGMATQQGIDPKELRHASKKFGVFVVNFGLDRLVDPEAVRRLKGRGVGYLEIAPGSHNAGFAPAQAERISAASDAFFQQRADRLNSAARESL